MDYRRIWQAGGCYFFTVVTHQRQHFLTQTENLLYLRQAFHHVRQQRPFMIDAIVVLPDHLHCIWRLPANDVDYPTRWRLIKHFVTCKIRNNGTDMRGENIWQKRYWEHCIRNEKDWRNHMDYIHYNPVKHGYVSSPAEWPYSSLARAVQKGWYDEVWGNNIDKRIMEMDFE